MKVEMLDVGWLTTTASLVRTGSADEPIRFPVPAYLIETATERILVDTGLHPEAVADPEGFYGGDHGVALFRLEQELSIADQVDLSTLTKVVLTHLHFDHVGALSLVPAEVPSNATSISPARTPTRSGRSSWSTATTTSSATARSAYC